MIDRTRLLGANAIAVTGGSIFLVIGGGVGLIVRRAINNLGSADQADGILLIVAATCYLLATIQALRINKNELAYRVTCEIARIPLKYLLNIKEKKI